jgi:hypothetical protein
MLRAAANKRRRIASDRAWLRGMPSVVALAASSFAAAPVTEGHAIDVPLITA